MNLKEEKEKKNRWLDAVVARHVFGVWLKSRARTIFKTRSRSLFLSRWHSHYTHFASSPLYSYRVSFDSPLWLRQMSSLSLPLSKLDSERKSCIKELITLTFGCTRVEREEGKKAGLWITRKGLGRKSVSNIRKTCEWCMHSVTIQCEKRCRSF